MVRSHSLALAIGQLLSSSSASPIMRTDSTFFSMPRVNLSSMGPEVSRVALGILHLGQDPKVRSVADARSILEAAVAAGITTFDLADNYAAGHCLAWFGAAVKALNHDHPGWRDAIQVIAKIGEIDDGSYAAGGALPWLDTSRAYTENITDYFLSVLGASHLDVLVYHWPDRLTNPSEVAATFKALHESGKVRHFGVSNYTPLQYKLLAAATAKLGVPLVTNEVAVSPWMPQTYDDGTLEEAMLDGIRPLAWGPLGGDPSGGANFLFKKQWPVGSAESSRQSQIRAMLRQVAEELSAPSAGTAVTEDLVALAWTLKHPSGIVPIIGTMSMTRIALQAGLAPRLAERMTRKQWWEIADVSGVRIWGGAVPFVPPKQND